MPPGVFALPLPFHPHYPPLTVLPHLSLCTGNNVSGSCFFIHRPLLHGPHDFFLLHKYISLGIQSSQSWESMSVTNSAPVGTSGMDAWVALCWRSSAPNINLTSTPRANLLQPGTTQDTFTRQFFRAVNTLLTETALMVSPNGRQVAVLCTTV